MGHFFIRRATHRVLLASAAALAGCNSPPAEPVVVGGVSVGMDMDAYRKVASVSPGFRIDGVTSPDSAPQATFVEGRLTFFRWTFSAKDYEQVRDALRAKYPRMRCRQGGDERETCTIDQSFFLWQGAGRGFPSRVVLKK